MLPAIPTAKGQLTNVRAMMLSIALWAAVTVGPRWPVDESQSEDEGEGKSEVEKDCEQVAGGVQGRHVTGWGFN